MAKKRRMKKASKGLEAKRAAYRAYYRKNKAKYKHYRKTGKWK